MIQGTSMQKLNFSKLRLLHDVACKHDDAHMADFIGETPSFCRAATYLCLCLLSFPKLSKLCML